MIPIFIEGLQDLMPKGQRSPRPAAVHVRIGAPVSLAGRSLDTDGTARLEHAMRSLAELPRREVA